MNYETLYKEALEKAKDLLSGTYGELTESTKSIIHDFFPELKESEDERIRKEITEAVNLYCTEYSRGTKVRNDMLALLEKQRPVDNNAVAIIEDEIKRRLECFKSEKDKEDASQIDKLSLGGRTAVLQELLAFIHNKMPDIKKQNPVTPPKFTVGDNVVSTNNPRLTYKVLEVGNINELGNLEYKVEIFTDGKDEKPHNIRFIECNKMDKWGELIEQKPIQRGKKKRRNAKKGKRYKCIYANCFVDRDWVGFSKGKIYLSPQDGYLINDEGREVKIADEDWDKFVIVESVID